MMPIRTCLSCRTEAPRAELLRLVVGPDGTPAIDFSGRLPGRGAYVCWQGSCLDGADARGRLSRAFRRPVTTPEPGWARAAARRHLEGHIAETCSLARRSGALKSGAHTVDMSFRRGWVRLGLTSHDAGADTSDRMRRRCEKAGVERYELPLSSEELGRALGKGIRSVAVIGGGSLSKELERSLHRYRGLL